MALDKLQGFEEMSRDVDEVRRRFLHSMAPEQRLEGLGARERLEGLGAKEKEELLALLLAEREQTQR